MPARRPRSEDLVTKVLDDFRRIVQVLRSSSRVVEQRLGLSGAQLFVLKTLSAGRPLSLNELAARTRTHQSTVSVVVKRLVARGLVRRAVSSVDARRVALSPTAAGLARLDRAPMAAQEQLIAGMTRLPASEQRTLARCMRHLVSSMDIDAAPATMFFEEQRPKTRKTRRNG